MNLCDIDFWPARLRIGKLACFSIIQFLVDVFKSVSFDTLFSIIMPVHAAMVQKRHLATVMIVSLAVVCGSHILTALSTDGETGEKIYPV